MVHTKGAHPHRVVHILCLFLYFMLEVAAQGCSASKPCATGCCSKYGYCGTGPTFCAADVCVANCNYTATAQCSADKHCKEGCCSKFGVCGFGPDYCKKENCVSTCDRKSQCDPDNWGSTYANATNCPLNVCCSKYGFCGTTEEFCGTKKVKRPSCKAGKSLSRVVGYYEGWAPTRPCHAFWPEQIPPGVYTHLNYAFARVDPNTFDVLPPNSKEGDLMKRLTDLKTDNPGLRVNIAIGGWTFNDPGPTASIFTNLAASEENQNKFFKSLTSFMATYGFDGVDIDWEYPVDPDRSGRGQDFQNFPKFMANLKHALNGMGGRGELSVTLPTSYWYLQNFDIKSLAKSVDYFNYMSYDLHGMWDRGNKWTGEFLNAHTNLTEITDTLDLLWRNNIPPDKVVMGLAFYSRSFTVQNTNCMTPGCLFASGSNPGPCSGQTGILLNSELDDIRASKNIKPTLNSDAAVELLTWDDQWASYDDAQTFKLKVEFAKKTCLGGVMVWAVSHDTYNGTYSRALSGVVPQSKPINMLETSADGTMVTISTRTRQCKWTACGETCSGDYVAVSRSDPGYREGELMLDGVTCSDGLVHTLCCPKENVPKCGWYTHNNGNCDPQCPSSTFEIGSLSDGLCYNSYQAACCETGQASTSLYGTLEWSQYPMCDQGSCPWVDSSKSKTLTVADSGSGDAPCNVREYSYSTGLTVQERKLCYNPNNINKTWDNCAWYRYGNLPDLGESPYKCSDACPSDKVRLATYQFDYKNCDGGTRAYCCSDNYYVNSRVVDPEIRQFEGALSGYRVNGTCPLRPDGSTGLLGKRDPLITDWDRAVELVRRDSSNYDNYALAASVLATLLKTNHIDLSPKQAAQESSWDTWAAANKFDGLKMDTLRPFVQQSRAFNEEGAQFEAQNILCRLDSYNSLAKGEEPVACLGDPCSPDNDPDLCNQEALDIGDGGDDSDHDSLSVLTTRKLIKKYRVWCDNPPPPASPRWVGLELEARDFPRAGEWKPEDRVYNSARTYQDRDDCANPLIDSQVRTRALLWDTEHIVELQIIPMFFEAITSRTLVSGNTPSFQRVDCSFFLPTSQGGRDLLHLPLTQTSPIYAGDQTDENLEFRLMTSLGSRLKRDNFYLLEHIVNGMKARVFGNKRLVTPERWIRFVNNLVYPGIALKEIKAAIAVWHYLNDADVSASFVNIVTDLRKVFKAIDDQYNNGNSVFVAAWDEWWADEVRFQVDRTRTWVNRAISDMRQVWSAQPATSILKLLVLSTLVQLENYATELIRYDQSVFPTGNTFRAAEAEEMTKREK